VIAIINDLLDLLIKEEKKSVNNYISNYSFIYRLFVQADSRFDLLRQEIEDKLKDEKFVDAVKHIIHVSLSKSVLSQYEKFSQDERNYIAKNHAISAALDIDYLLKNNIFDYGTYIFNRISSRYLQDTN
jgi:hypothetical protein